MMINEKLYSPITACPVCGKQESRVIKTETNHFSTNLLIQYEADPVYLMQCKNCDFCYTDKLPKDSFFYETLYNLVSYNYEYEHDFHGKRDIYKDIKQKLSKYCPSGSLLDVGSWCGTLLTFMKDTYTAVGCEISQPAASYAKSIGLNVRIGSFDAVDFESESFDVITIIDVLEHLPQPGGILEKIHRLLKPNGVVYIKVPNIQAQINKQNLLNTFNFSKGGVCTNYVHINHFSHKSLEKILLSLGFEVVEKGYTKAEIWDLSFSDPYSIKFKKFIDNQIRKAVTMTASLISYTSGFDTGFNIYIIAQKSSIG